MLTISSESACKVLADISLSALAAAKLAPPPVPNSWSLMSSEDSSDANASLKLSFIRPCRERLKVAVFPEDEMAANLIPWGSSLIGYVMDHRTIFYPP